MSTLESQLRTELNALDEISSELRTGILDTHITNKSTITAIDTLPVSIKDLQYSTLTILTSAERSVSGISSTHDVGNYLEGNFFLDVSAVVTPATLDCNIKTLDPVSGSSFDLFAFTQVIDVPSREMKALSGTLGSRILADYSIAAGSLTFSLGALVKKG